MGYTSAVKLNSSACSATQPVYFSGGKPVATTYTLGKSVPSDAKFTDTTYSSLKNPYALTIQGNGTTLKTYDGSSAQTVNITPSNIGAAESNHSHSYLALSGGTITDGETGVIVENIALNRYGVSGKNAMNVIAKNGNLTLYGKAVVCNLPDTTTRIPIYASAFNTSSSKRYKENINPITEEDALKLLQLNPVTYDYINKKQGTNCYGLIAEEVEKILNYPVSYNENGEVEGLDYSKFIPFLIKLVQMQQEEINTLKDNLN